MPHSPTPTDRPDHDERRIFRMINAAFWLCWAGIAVILATAWVRHEIGDTADLLAALKDLGAVDAHGQAIAPESIGTGGRIVVRAIEILSFGFDFAILVPMHRMVYLCAYHEVWLARTMRNLSWLAILLIVPSIFQTLVINAGHLYFHLQAGAPRFLPTLVGIDPVNIAAGLFVFVLRLIMKQAVSMHREQELTV